MDTRSRRIERHPVAGRLLLPALAMTAVVAASGCGSVGLAPSATVSQATTAAGPTNAFAVSDIVIGRRASSRWRR